MFSAVWPLAALVCLGHTIFRLRSNVLRLTRLSMRPVPEATSGIGLWHNLLLFEARACVLVNCLIVSVSTDDDSIADLAHRSGATVVDRPMSLAGDTATSESALLHALDELGAEDGRRSCSQVGATEG